MEARRGGMEKSKFLAEIKKQAQEIGSLKAQLAGTNSVAKTWTAPEGYRTASERYRGRNSDESNDNDIVIIITILIVAVIAIGILIYMFQ